jgi:hypothetical protein
MRNVIKNIRPEIEAALKEIAQRHGVVIKCGNGSYTNSNFTLKLEASAIDAVTGAVATKEAEAYKRNAPLYGLQADWLGQTFQSYSGDSYKVIGMKPKSTKYPILGERADGKVFKFGTEMVKFCFQKKAA